MSILCPRVPPPRSLARPGRKVAVVAVLSQRVFADAPWPDAASPRRARSVVGHGCCQGVFMHTTPDGRPIPPGHAGERAMLEAWLDFHRATLVLKCSGLDDEQARLASAPPSSMTLLGLVQHMAEVERNWFQRVFAGRDVPAVFGESNLDGFALQRERGLDEATAVWRAEVARGRELIVDASLDDSCRLPEQEAWHVGDGESPLSVSSTEVRPAATLTSLSRPAILRPCLR